MSILITILVAICYVACGFLVILWGGLIDDDYDPLLMDGSEHTKETILTAILSVSAWPLLVVYCLIIIAPIKFFRYWRDLPDNSKPTQ